ncbi:MAG: glycoside hydrolase family 19 protein [Flavobacteriales bacterium]|nr:glycoside hydrolase family 19 protein [Flavobacteriales bacterium]
MSLKRLQELSGVTADGTFGPNTFRATSKFLGLTLHARAVHFFAQCGHESGNFKFYTENLNYSSKALRSVFGKYFPTTELAEEYARKPEAIANRVYANRMGNGDEASGDGWKFRGRGAIQLTGSNNYNQFSKHIGDDSIISNPEIVSTDHSFTSAQFFFEKNNLWSICDRGLDEDTIKQLTKRINGGYNGLEDRIKLTNKYSQYSL